MTDKPKNKAITIPVPDGFHPPDPVEGRQGFDVVCTFEADGEGKLRLTMIGNTPVGEVSAKQDTDEKMPVKPGYENLMAGGGVPDGAGSGY